MTSVAVIAHSAKTFDGGLPALRRTLAGYGFVDPPWIEVAKAKKIPKQARRLRDEGADVLFVWGGDGTVQRALDALAGSDTQVAILPAGTANLFATNLGVPGIWTEPCASDCTAPGERSTSGRPTVSISASCAAWAWTRS